MSTFYGTPLTEPPLKVYIWVTLECVNKCVVDDGSYNPEFTKTLIDNFPDETAYKKCRSTLNLSAKLESLVICINVVDL